MSEEIPLRDQLERYYRETMDREVVISDFTPISDGWETEVYSFTLTLRHQVELLILRMYPGMSAAEKCEREYKGIFVLRHVGGYPVPGVFLHEVNLSWLGKPFLTMQKIDGRPLGDVMREDWARQPELLTRFVQLLVNLHHTNYRQIADPLNLQEAFSWLPALLARWRIAIVADRGQVWVASVLDWLDAGASTLTIPPLSPLHGDFHPNNVLITLDDKLYVIDWSGFAVGDYRYDLAWTLMMFSTYGYPELRPLILNEYARLSGHPVEQIEYFDVIAALRRLFDFAVSLGSGAEALGMRPETVAVMRGLRDHYQAVYDLLQARTGLRLSEIERLLDTLKG